MVVTLDEMKKYLIEQGISEFKIIMDTEFGIKFIAGANGFSKSIS